VSAREHSATPPVVDVPSLLAPPPLLYLGTLAIGLLLHWWHPLALFPRYGTAFLLGGCLLLLSAAFARWAFVSMKQVGTSANPYTPATSLTTDGPFRYSRNPIYLAMTGLYLGIGLLFNALAPMLLLLPLLAAMNWGVVRREENYLTARFGIAYRDYCRQVRRWC